MKKIFLAAIVCTVLSIPAMAQEKKDFSFSVGPELGFAVGSFNDRYSVAIGGTAQAEYKILDKLKATATVGVLAYTGKSVMIGGLKYKYPAQRIVPLRIGAKYYLIDRFYGAAQLGVAFLGNYYSTTAFAYSPIMLGYEFQVGTGKSFDATVKYDGYTGSGGMGTIGNFGIRVAYVF